MSGSKKKQYRIVLFLAVVLAAGLCLFAVFAMLGSGLALWLSVDQTAAQSSVATPRPTRRDMATFTPTLSPTPIPMAIATQTPAPSATPTPAPSPTETVTATPVPTETNTPTKAPLTATPLPAPTETPPPPSFQFAVKETESFPTSHLDFDIYIAITDQDNKPLSGYRVVGAHSDGSQIISESSADDWTVNSGAMHYKGGNLKYSVPKSPGGVWTLQLVDENGNPAAPAVEFPFDQAAPAWYFILYRRD